MTPGPESSLFSDGECQDLMAHFEGRPVSRVSQVTVEDDGLRLSGWLANTHAAPEDLQLRLDGEVLPGARLRRWRGMEDPKPARVFPWWPNIGGYRFSVSMGPVLERGSGCGRLSRHLIAHGLPLTGIDIDEEAVAWCNAKLAPTAKSEARFLKCDLFPPTPLDSASFRLAIGVSVITHLDEEAGHQWLAELARLLRPGGIFMLTTHGLDTFSEVDDARIYRAVRKDGFYSVRSAHLDSLLGEEQEYYRETWHSENYIRDNWSRWFTLVRLFPGAHFGFQDLVILRRNAVVS